MIVSNNALMLNVFSWLAETIIGGFFSIIMTAFTVILEVLSTIFSQFLYFIGISLLKILNFIQSLVRKLVGLETYWWDGAVVDGELAGQDPVLRLITDPKVLEVFLAMLIIAIVVLIIAVITQLFRLEYTTEGAQNTKGKLFGKAFKALAMFLIVPIGTSMGIIVGNQLLKSLDAATNPSGSAYISGAIFSAAASDANRAIKIKAVTEYYIALDQDPNSGDGAYDPNSPSAPIRDANGEVVTDEHGVIRDSDGNRLVPVSKLSDKGEGFEVVKGFIEKYVGGGMYNQATFTLNGGSLQATYTYTPNFITEFTGSEKVVVTFTSNRGDLIAQQIDIANQIDEAFSAGQAGLDYMNVEHVSAFYNLGEINYLILYAAAIMALYVLFNVIFGLILRLYKVAVYFMVSPPIIALMPIYETAFVEWRKAIVATIISAYSAVVGLNLFIMLLPILKNIQLFDPNIDITDTVGLNINTGIGLNRGLNAYTYLLIVIAGCFLLKELIANISKWIAAEDAFKSGSDVSKKITSTAGKAVMTATGAGLMGAGMLKNAAMGAGKGGVGLAQSAAGQVRRASAQRLYNKADKLDRAGRDDQGRLIKGHQLQKATEMKRAAADRMTSADEWVKSGNKKLKQVTVEPVKKVGSGIAGAFKKDGAIANAVMGAKGHIDDTMGSMRGSASSIFRGYMGVDDKANKPYREKRESTETKRRNKVDEEEKLKSTVINNLNVDKVKGNVDTMKGGIESAKAALSKPGGKAEALTIAQSLDKVSDSLVTGFEHVGDELRKLVLQSKDGKGLDVSSSINNLLSRVSQKGDDYTVSVSNIVKAGTDETKLKNLSEADRKILDKLIKIEAENRKKKN